MAVRTKERGTTVHVIAPAQLHEPWGAHRVRHLSGPRATGPRARVVVLVIVISAVIGLVFAGQDAPSAVALVAAAGIAAVEIATRLLGAPTAAA
jgi:hypothetical protein